MSKPSSFDTKLELDPGPAGVFLCATYVHMGVHMGVCMGVCIKWIGLQDRP